MLIAKRGADIKTDDIWICLSINRSGEREKIYYNAFPLSIKSTLDGREWTLADHQVETHGTTHKDSVTYKVVADLTSKDWVTTEISSLHTCKHPRMLDTARILIAINDDDIRTDKEQDLLRATLREEMAVYVKNSSLLSEALRNRVLSVGHKMRLT